MRTRQYISKNKPLTSSTSHVGAYHFGKISDMTIILILHPIEILKCEFCVSLTFGKWRGERFDERAVFLDDGRREVEKVLDLQQLRVGVLGQMDLKQNYKYFLFKKSN